MRLDGWMRDRSRKTLRFGEQLLGLLPIAHPDYVSHASEFLHLPSGVTDHACTAFRVAEHVLGPRTVVRA
jgi:hypothetical protein